jgi:hypothetical protein
MHVPAYIIYTQDYAVFVLVFKYLFRFYYSIGFWQTR